MRFAPTLVIASAIAATPIATASCQQLGTPKIEWVEASATVPFVLYRGNRVVAPGTVNGRSVEFILDTGASVTTIDRAYARSIGIPPGEKIAARGAGGMQEAELVHDLTLTIGGMKMTDVTAAVIDLKEVSAAIGRPMNVILGRELFNHAGVTIDWQAQTLRVESQDQVAAGPNAREVKLLRKGPFNFLDVSVEGLEPVTAVLDLGNGGALSLPDRYWSKQPELARLRYAESQAGGVGGLHSARAVTLGRVDFAGQTFAAVPATLGGTVHAGAEDSPNVGIGLLRQFKVTLDLGRDRMFLEPLSSPPGFRRDRSGLRTKMIDGKLEVSFVSPNSPGARAGIKAGDGIEAINGRKVEHDFYSGDLNDWADRPSGSPVTLTLAGGRTIRFTLEDYF